MSEQPCNSEKIRKMKDAFERALIELNKIGKINNAIIGQNLFEINNDIDNYCLTSLGKNASIMTSSRFLYTQLNTAANKLKSGMTKTAKECIPHIQNMLRFFNEEYKSEAEPEYKSAAESEYKSTSQQKSTLFPSHKYLDLSDKSEFPQVKSKYRELSLMYHPDKCPNDKTPGMDKSQCETEFKILNNEYNQIKQDLNIVGGRKRKTRRSSRKSYKNKSNTKKSMSKKNKRKNKRKTSRK